MATITLPARPTTCQHDEPLTSVCDDCMADKSLLVTVAKLVEQHRRGITTDSEAALAITLVVLEAAER